MVMLSKQVLDARGRPLQEGDEIILSLAGPVYYRVMGITPNLDPNGDPKKLMIHVAAIVAFDVADGVINSRFIRVRTIDEAGPMPFSLADVHVPKPAGSPS